MTFHFEACRLVRRSFSNRHMIDVVLVTHSDLILIPGSWLQQRVIGDHASSVGQKGGAFKDENQLSPAVGRDAHIDRGLRQLNRAFIIGRAV